MSLTFHHNSSEFNVWTLRKRKTLNIHDVIFRTGIRTNILYLSYVEAYSGVGEEERTVLRKILRPFFFFQVWWVNPSNCPYATVTVKRSARSYRQGKSEPIRTTELIWWWWWWWWFSSSYKLCYCWTLRYGRFQATVQCCVMCQADVSGISNFELLTKGRYLQNWLWNHGALGV
jgi:hypothetical protein